VQGSAELGEDIPALPCTPEAWSEEENPSRV